jgi:DNA-binding LacI/PurR family transcriptional regulator
MILIIMRPDENPNRAARLLRPGHVDGAIIVSHHREGPLQQAEHRPAVPTVYIGRPEFIEDSKSLIYVDVDNQAIGKMATARLISSGATKVASIAGPVDMAPVQDRAAGWRAELAAAGLEPGPIDHDDFTMQGGEKAMRRILETGQPFDAIFAQSDLMAAGAIHVLNEAGIRVPEDVRIVSVDNSEIAATSTPQLTSVTNPSTELAVAATQFLMALLDGTAEDGPTLLHPELVIRESG